MKVYIPSRGTVAQNIIDAIAMQTIPTEIEIVPGNYDEIIPKRRRIAMAKTECLFQALKTADDFIVINDADMLNLQDDNYEAMQEFLMDNPIFGAVSLVRSKVPDSDFDLKNPVRHICNSIIMIRREALRVIRFDLIPNAATCFSVMQSLMKSKMKYGYVDREIRAKHEYKL